MWLTLYISDGGVEAEAPELSFGKQFTCLLGTNAAQAITIDNKLGDVFNIINIVRFEHRLLDACVSTAVH